VSRIPLIETLKWQFYMKDSMQTEKYISMKALKAVK